MVWNKCIGRGKRIKVLPTHNAFIFHCHISFIFQTILLLLLFARPSYKLFFYATIWTLFVQEIYYIVELINYYYKCDYTKPIQNIAWSSSVYILSYWIFRSIFHWVDKSPIWLEILMHGANSALVILAVFMNSKLNWKYLKWLYLYYICYFIVAVTYTNITKDSIYPTNFFSFDDFSKLYISLISVIFWPIISTWCGLFLFKPKKEKEEDDDISYNLV